LRRRRRLAPRQNRRLVTRSVPAASAFGAKKRLTSFVALSARMEAHRFAPARLALSRASCSDATARASATATSSAFCRTLTMPISSISVGEEPITKSLPPHRRLQSATSSRRLNLLRLLRQRRRRLRSAWVLVAAGLLAGVDAGPSVHALAFCLRICFLSVSSRHPDLRRKL